MAAVGDDIPLSGGGELLLERLLSLDERPLWVLVWGGSNVLAQVLYKIRDRPDAVKLRSKLRVYAISDQDDTGAWIRQQWADIFYICSVHGWNSYAAATWRGISGQLPGEEGGPDGSKVTKAWIKEHIQIGPLGAVYPDFMHIPEGDTPTFLYLIQNGLGVPDQPSYGSWGGRYLPVNVSEHGLPREHFADTPDEVVGADGRKFVSTQATIWRWRNAFQDDFAARMQWTLTSDITKANHSPVISIDGNAGTSTIYIDAHAGSTISFDASATYVPDGDELSFNWFQYREPSAMQTYLSHEVADLHIKTLNAEGHKVEVAIPPADRSCMILKEKIPLERGSPLHLILEVKDNGRPSLTSYRRVIIQPTNRA
jgi:hypothetical protein